MGASSALRRCWHLVGDSSVLGSAPVAVTLLDEPLVLWRDSARVVHAFRDVCVHRGTTRRTRYALDLPYTIVEHIDWGGRDGMVYFFASQPVSANRCVGCCLVARNYNLDQPDEIMQEFERTVFGQDQRIVESQRPEQVPFDLAAELHLIFDAVAVAYRRAMRANGLDRSDGTPPSP